VPRSQQHPAHGPRAGCSHSAPQAACVWRVAPAKNRRRGLGPRRASGLLNSAEFGVGVDAQHVLAKGGQLEVVVEPVLEVPVQLGQVLHEPIAVVVLVVACCTCSVDNSLGVDKPPPRPRLGRSYGFGDG